MKYRFLFVLLLVLISCNRQSKDARINVPNYTELARLDKPLPRHDEGGWLSQHKENGQDLSQYIKTDPLGVSATKNVIYLQPIGMFSGPQRQLLKLTQEYIRYFFGLKTVMLEPIPVSHFPADKKRFKFDTEQLDAGYIIREVLPDEMPEDGLVVIGLTACDLYPQPSWNYVFGLASRSKHAAVTSMHRFIEPDFSSSNYALCLSRLIKTATHEIGHMFSMAHCTHAACLMNGANHLGELDESPNTLCSLCLAKLSWNLGFDHTERMEDMVAFCARHSLEEDGAILKQQLQILKRD